jgi:hypothetical protein
MRVKHVPYGGTLTPVILPQEYCMYSTYKYKYIVALPRPMVYAISWFSFLKFMMPSCIRIGLSFSFCSSQTQSFNCS